MSIKPASEYNTEIDWINTGISTLDTILGGGVPITRILEISGVASVGKTTLGLMILGEAQKLGKKTVYFDLEFTYNNSYAEKMGVDTTKLFLVREDHAEAAMDVLETFAAKNKDSVILIDAIGALLPKAEAEKTAEGKVIGGQAVIVARMTRKLVPLLHLNNHALIVLNHSFKDIMTGALKTSGGAKLEYAKSISINLRKSPKRVMRGDQRIGDVIEVEVRKNKVAPTNGQKCELVLLYGDGFQRQQGLMEEAINRGVLTKKGQMWYMGEEKIARGDNALRDALKDETLAAKIKDALQVI